VDQSDTPLRPPNAWHHGGCEIRVVATHERSVSAGRNIGAGAARHNILVFTHLRRKDLHMFRRTLRDLLLRPVRGVRQLRHPRRALGELAYAAGIVRGAAEWTRAAIIALGLLALSPGVAGADWLFMPSAGTTFARDTHGREHAIFTADAGWTDYDPPLGWQIDFSLAPDFFGGRHPGFTFTGRSHVVTLMLNGVIGDLAAITSRRGWRPYVTAGVGVIQVHVITERPGRVFDTWVHEAGFNAGGGVLVFVTDHIGVHADVRYLQSFQDGAKSWTYDESTVDVAPGRFDFFRGTVGIAVRFGGVRPSRTTRRGPS
jgi:hypothetical protein